MTDGAKDNRSQNLSGYNSRFRKAKYIQITLLKDDWPPIADYSDSDGTI